MKIKSAGAQVTDIDMTPMIDMTFQLIAFFMILINFDAADQDDRITLPQSTLAKPREAPADTPITVQLTRSGQAIVAGQTYADTNAIKPVLNNEKYVLESQNKAASSATVVIRAHKDVKTGLVQSLIKICQEVGFEKFTLRAKEELQ